MRNNGSEEKLNGRQSEMKQQIHKLVSEIKLSYEQTLRETSEREAECKDREKELDSIRGAIQQQQQQRVLLEQLMKDMELSNSSLVLKIEEAETEQLHHEETIQVKSREISQIRQAKLDFQKEEAKQSSQLSSTCALEQANEDLRRQFEKSIIAVSRLETELQFAKERLLLVLKNYSLIKADQKQLTNKSEMLKYEKSNNDERFLSLSMKNSLLCGKLQGLQASRSIEASMKRRSTIHRAGRKQSTSNSQTDDKSINFITRHAESCAKEESTKSIPSEQIKLRNFQKEEGTSSFLSEESETAQSRSSPKDRHASSQVVPLDLSCSASSSHKQQTIMNATCQQILTLSSFQLDGNQDEEKTKKTSANKNYSNISQTKVTSTVPSSITKGIQPEKASQQADSHNQQDKRKAEFNSSCVIGTEATKRNMIEKSSLPTTRLNGKSQSRRRMSGIVKKTEYAKKDNGISLLGKVAIGAGIIAAGVGLFLHFSKSK